MQSPTVRRSRPSPACSRRATRRCSVRSRWRAGWPRRSPRPPGTKVLVVVDDAQLLDERSAQVLLQLAAEGTATVLGDGPRPRGARRRTKAVAGRMVRADRAGRACPMPRCSSSSRRSSDAPGRSGCGARIRRPRRGQSAAAARAGRRRAGRRRRSCGAARDGRWPANRRSAAASATCVRSRLAALPDAQRAALETVAAGEPLAAGGRSRSARRGRCSTSSTPTGSSRVRTGLAGPEVSGGASAARRGAARRNPGAAPAPAAPVARQPARGARAPVAARSRPGRAVAAGQRARPTNPSVCWPPPAPRAASAWIPPSDWPGTRTRPAVRCRRRCCSPRSSLTAAAAPRQRS